MKNTNLPLRVLQKCIADHDIVYCYIITTIKNLDGKFVQTGCGPNFQGDLVTLCTCKHHMRTFFDPNDWTDKWIAGFTGTPAGNGRNFLVYLMQISQAFESHYKLWYSKDVSVKAKRAKAAHYDKFGDIWKPRRRGINPFDWQEYIRPCRDHVHAEGWDNDIAYRKRKHRVPALLVGDPRRSFLWDRPIIRYSGKLYRGQTRLELYRLLYQLKSGRSS